MISKHLCRLSRSFSSKKPYYSSIFKSNMIYFGVGALVFLGFRAFSKYKDPEASRVQRVKAIKENISKPKEFAGVKRDSDYEDIIKIGDQKMILIYGVPKSGMTTFLNEIETRVHPSTVLKIEIKEDLEETLNQFSFEHKLNAIEVLKFFKNVESAITEAKSEKTYVLIDGMEKLMPGVIDIFWKNFWKFVKIDGATVIVTFSDLKYLNNSYSYGTPEIRTLSNFTHDQFVQIFEKADGFNYRVASEFYSKVGPDMEWALEMQKGNTGLKNFFDVKTSKIEEDIRNLISQYPEYSLGVKEALASVTEVKPYGDIFVATQMARDLINAGLMQEHLNGSVRFRNKFVMQTLQNLLNK